MVGTALLFHANLKDLTIFVKNMELHEFHKAARWVLTNQPTSKDGSVSVDSICTVLSHFYEILQKLEVSLCIPNLFPNIELTTLYIPPADRRLSETERLLYKKQPIELHLPTQQANKAVEAIGAALLAEMSAHENGEVTHYKLDGADLVIFRPYMHDLILHAFGMTEVNATH